MSAVIQWSQASEVTRGISGDSDSRSVKFLAKLDAPPSDADPIVRSDEVVLDYAEGNAPSTWDGMQRGQFGIEQLSPIYFLVTANYKAGGGGGSLREVDAEETKKASFSFEIGGEDLEITHGLAEQSFVEGGAEFASDFGLAIGVEIKEGKIEIKGVQIPATTQDFEIALTAPHAFYTAEYRSTLARLANTINDDAFLTFLKGEVLFRGARGRIESTGSSELVLRFSVKRNPVLPKAFFGITINHPIVGDPVVINGWDVVWPFMQEEDGGDVLEPKAKSVHVNRVFEYSDFDLLGLPTVS